MLAKNYASEGVRLDSLTDDEALAINFLNSLARG
jgi:hypothetical protein